MYQCAQLIGLAATLTVIFGLAACERAPQPQRGHYDHNAMLQVVTPLRHQSGDLVDVIRSLRLPGKQSYHYLPPNDGQIDDIKRALTALLGGHLPEAITILSRIGMDASVLHDRNHTFLLIREVLTHEAKGWGVIVINEDSDTPGFIQAPHPINDMLTDVQAAAMFRSTNAFALLVSTSYRCATIQRSACSGRTSACDKKGRRQRFRESDMAHTSNTIFQAVHETIVSLRKGLLVLQLHGFDRRPGRKWHYVVSNGTNRPTRSALSNRLVKYLRGYTGRKFSAVSCNGWRRRIPLCGTYNVQGRFSNGSSNPCTVRPRQVSHRFLHIEQSYDARTPYGHVFPGLLEKAVMRLLAELNPSTDFAVLDRFDVKKSRLISPRQDER